jgi:hypothetical protein
MIAIISTGRVILAIDIVVNLKREINARGTGVPDPRRFPSRIEIWKIWKDSNLPIFVCKGTCRSSNDVTQSMRGRDVSGSKQSTCQVTIAPCAKVIWHYGAHEMRCGLSATCQTQEKGRCHGDVSFSSMETNVSKGKYVSADDWLTGQAWALVGS